MGKWDENERSLYAVCVCQQRVWETDRGREIHRRLFLKQSSANLIVRTILINVSYLVSKFSPILPMIHGPSNASYAPCDYIYVNSNNLVVFAVCLQHFWGDNRTQKSINHWKIAYASIIFVCWRVMFDSKHKSHSNKQLTRFSGDFRPTARLSLNIEKFHGRSTIHDA